MMNVTTNNGVPRRINVVLVRQELALLGKGNVAATREAISFSLATYVKDGVKLLRSFTKAEAGAAKLAS